MNNRISLISMLSITNKAISFLAHSLFVGNHAICSTWGNPKTAMAQQDRDAPLLAFSF
jgi:hypothetical protein